MDQTTARLARFAASYEFGSLSAEVIHECKRRIIDSVACAAAAFAEPFCARARTFCGRYMATPPARVWGTGSETSVEMAGFANGIMTRFLDYNDTFLSKGAGHPSDMIGGLLALAEAYERDGAALITAIVLAYEVYCSLCEAVALDAKGLDQAVNAAVGTAAGASKLLDLSVEQTANAFALALAANLHLYNVRCGELSDWKGCAGPNGVRNGLFAALLARDGFTGPTAVVEGRTGFFDLIGRFEWLVGSFGRALLLGTNIKHYPVCYHGQAAVDGTIKLRGKVPLHLIEDIHVEVYDAAYRAMGNEHQKWTPSTRETADHSLPFAVAVTLEDGCITAASYGESRMRDARTKTLMEKVRVSSSPAMTAAFPARPQTRITIRDASGATHVQEVEFPKGHVRNPLSDFELEEKFLQNYTPMGDAKAARHCLRILWSAEEQANAARIVDALCPTARATH